MSDNRTSEQAEYVADGLWKESEETTYVAYGATKREEAIFTMLRAILIELRSQRKAKR